MPTKKKGGIPGSVQAEIEKIRAAAPGIAAAYDYFVASGSLPAEEAAIMAGESLDAVGGKRAAVGRAERELTSKRARNKGHGFSRDFECQSLEATLAAVKKEYAAAVAGHVAKGLGTAAATAAAAGAKFKEIPLTSTDTETAPSPTGITLQRIVGLCCVAEHEAKVASDAAAAKAAAAEATAALAVFDDRVLEATPELARTVIDTAKGYQGEMDGRRKVSGEVDGLARMEAAPGRWPQRAPAAAASSKKGKEEQLPVPGEPLTEEAAARLVAGSSDGAPDPASPAFALWNRHQATSGSIVLYQLLCGLVSALSLPGVTVVPGAVKALPRYTYKVVEKYGGDFGGCRDLIRATIQVSSLADAATVVEALYQSGAVFVVRRKDRFNQSAAEVLPAGGYRDFQALCLFEVAPGVYRWGEVQVNLDAMVAIKSKKGGGHAAFKFARSIGAFYPGSYEHSGGCDEGLCARIKAGGLLKVDLGSDKAMKKDPALLRKFCDALGAETCRLVDLK